MLDLGGVLVLAPSTLIPFSLCGVALKHHEVTIRFSLGYQIFRWLICIGNSEYLCIWRVCRMAVTGRQVVAGCSCKVSTGRELKWIKFGNICKFVAHFLRLNSTLTRREDSLSCVLFLAGFDLSTMSVQLLKDTYLGC